MPTIADLYEYSKLATGAYVLLDAGPFDGATIAAKANADDQRCLPAALANQTFDKESDEGRGRAVWAIPRNAYGSGYSGNDGTGFAATLFERAGAAGTVEKVLAIRGTEPTLDSRNPLGSQLSRDLVLADLTQIGFVGFALAQTVSMMNLMLRLRAPLGASVVQVRADFSFGPSAGRPSVPVFNGARP